MNIRLVDLPRQNKLLRIELLEVIGDVIDQAAFIEGKILEDFEKAFALYCGKKFGVGVNSGTDGIKLALMAYGIGEGDEVITAPNGYFSTAASISELKAKPIFVDINPDTYTLDVEKIKSAITENTKAIVPVHLYGQSVDMGPVLELVKESNLTVLEDACQAHGAKYKRKKIPVSESGVFSFYPGKNLGCFGDGGILVTDNGEVADMVRYLRNDGAKEKYVHKYFGTKSRLDTLQAAILNLKLKYLDDWNNKRLAHAKKYVEMLSKISELKTPKEADYANHVFHLFIVETDRRDELQAYLREKGIETGIHYPTPIHLQKPYLKMGFKLGDFPVTEGKAKRILSLPMFPELEEGEIEYVCQTIKQFFSNEKY